MLPCAEGAPLRSAHRRPPAQKALALALLALGLGGPSSSWAQEDPGPCLATSPAIIESPLAPSDPTGLIADCSALLAGLVTMVGTSTFSPDGWRTQVWIGDWDFVTLNADNTRVLKVEVTNQDFNGNMPDLSALTAMEVLDLSHNEIMGPITNLSTLTSLKTLDLSHNEISGFLPDLTGLTRLEGIWLNDNNMTGFLRDLRRLTNLRYFNVARNSFTGTLPALSGWSSLEQFNAEENLLTGRIPSLAGLTRMTRFHVGDNALTGHIPSLRGLLRLEELNLGNVKRDERGFGNELDGPIPNLNDLVALKELILTDNRLTGTIPDMTNLTVLSKLHLGHNFLSGPLTDISSIGNALDELDVQNNHLSGALPDLGRLTGMDKLFLSANAFTGNVPAWLDSMSSLDELSLCFTDFNAAGTLPVATESRRTGGDLTLFGCLRIDESGIDADEGTNMTFNLTYSSWPMRGRHGLYVVYRTVDQTATSLDYGSTREDVLEIRRLRGHEYTTSATITLPIYPDHEDEYHETFLLQLVTANKLAGDSPGTESGNVLWMPNWTANGRILGSGPPPTGPGTGDPDPDPPDPDPEDPDPDPDDPDPDPDDPDPGPDGNPVPVPVPDPGPDPTACDRLVAPYWQGTGGIAVRPKNGRSAVFRNSCRGAETTETLYANQAGLIVQLLRRESCFDDAGKTISNDISIEGVEDGGWYWIDGLRNSAVAPLICEVQLSGPTATIPPGVEANVRADATLFEHHATRLLGVVPHLKEPASGPCSVYEAPFWKGTGGVVVKAVDGVSATFTRACGGAISTQRLIANDDDGLIVQLMGGNTCTDRAGNALRSDVSIEGIEPGGWYWLNGDRNSTVTPLACADHLGGARATVPAGVDAEVTPTATLFRHHVDRLIGIVPHLRRN